MYPIRGTHRIGHTTPRFRKPHMFTQWPRPGMGWNRDGDQSYLLPCEPVSREGHVWPHHGRLAYQTGTPELALTASGSGWHNTQAAGSEERFTLPRAPATSTYPVSAAVCYVMDADSGQNTFAWGIRSTNDDDGILLGVAAAGAMGMIFRYGALQDNQTGGEQQPAIGQWAIMALVSRAVNNHDFYNYGRYNATVSTTATRDYMATATQMWIGDWPAVFDDFEYPILWGLWTPGIIPEALLVQWQVDPYALLRGTNMLADSPPLAPLAGPTTDGVMAYRKRSIRYHR